MTKQLMINGNYNIIARIIALLLLLHRHCHNRFFRGQQILLRVVEPRGLRIFQFAKKAALLPPLSFKS